MKLWRRIACRSSGEHDGDAVYRAAHLVESLPRPGPPAALWSRIEERLDAAARGAETGPAPGGVPPMRALRALLRPATLSATMALLIAVLGVVLWLWPGGDAAVGRQVDLSGYLEHLEKADATEGLRAVAAAPALFHPGDAREALAAAGLGPEESIARAAGYDLLERRVRELEQARVAQLVYGTTAERLAVFVAPAGVRFAVGNRGLMEHMIGGVRCHKLDCPRTTALLVETGQRRCLLIGRGADESRLASLVRLCADGGGER